MKNKNTQKKTRTSCANDRWNLQRWDFQHCSLRCSEVTGRNTFGANRLFSLTVCASSWVLFKKDAWLKLWHLEPLNRRGDNQKRWLAIFTITKRFRGWVCNALCRGNLTKGGETRCHLKSISKHIQRHIHLHHFMTLQIAPTPFDDVWYEHQAARNGKMRAGDKNSNKKC